MHEAAAIALEEQILEPQDLQRLFDEHAPRVRIALARLLGSQAEADDVLQDVFVLAWNKRHRMTGESARAFLYSIAVRLAANTRRLARMRQLFGLSTASDIADWHTPERAAEQSEARGLVYRALDRMSEKYRTVFILHELEELTGDEIAQVLGCAQSTVWTRLQVARQQFMESIVALRAAEHGASTKERE